MFHNSNVFGSCIIHILYIYSTNIWTEYFIHGLYSPIFFPLRNAVCFIILTYLVPILFTFYIFIQQIKVLNILNTVYTLRVFSSSKFSLFHNSNIFCSCIINILYTECAKIKKKQFERQKINHSLYPTADLNLSCSELRIGCEGEKHFNAKSEEIINTQIH